MNQEKGSQWHKWDLHVHTPASIVQHYEGQNEADRWENFILDLERLPREFKVIGINDYLFIEGYEKVLEYKRQGRIPNIETIFPVIEFRIRKFGGHKDFKRVNFHVIFSDKISPETIKQQFLSQLYGKYKLEPGVERKGWSGHINPSSLADLGRLIKASVSADKLAEYGSDSIEGFNNINFDEDEIRTILKKSDTYLEDKYLTAIGKTEWDEFKWGDSSIAEKKNVINDVNFVFTSAETIDLFNKAKRKLKEQNVNDLLLDCSDAHHNSSVAHKDRIGKCFTWINADLTFDGLRQVVNEPERVHTSGTPPLVRRIANNPSKFIDKVTLRKTENTRMSDVWFDGIEFDLNPSLVAIIGNKGNGKSALADIIGLLGNSYNEQYSFLTKRKFRNPHPYNKSSNLEARLTWADGQADPFSLLDKKVDANKPERVKYIPQNFLETLCVNEDEHDFEDEIKKIIFSHTEESNKLGFNSLDELIAYKSEVINKEMGSIKIEIEEQNVKIIALEKKSQPNFKSTIIEAIKEVELAIESHHSAKPEAVLEPTNDPELQARNRIFNDDISKLKLKHEADIATYNSLTIEKRTLVKDHTDLSKIGQTVRGLKTTIEHTIESQRDPLAAFGIDVSKIISFQIDLSDVDSLLTTKVSRLAEIDHILNGNAEQSGLEIAISSTKQQLVEAEQKLDEPFRLYQKYLHDQEEWQNRLAGLSGDATLLGSQEYFKGQLRYLNEQLTIDLENEYGRRDILIKKLFDKKQETIDLYSESYRPITEFIVSYGHLMVEYNINLSVELKLDGFVQKFFDHINQGSKGSYIGVEEGNRFLSDLIAQFNLNDYQGIRDFLFAIRESLFFDKRTDQGNLNRDIEAQLRKSYSIEDFYKFLYELDYLKPTFKLNLGDKSLSELSPGERGALLLIFYLFLDKDDKPLVIDQPEENLDNQSVYKYLVHFIKEAKQRRQIIIVTHNPNLAVVCDAEQIIHVSLDKVNDNAITYKSGAIENPEINKVIVDILEGTKPAFNNRTHKYYLNDN
jgi:ABC-type lipoprotein export system ATPase subunit